MIPDSPHQRMYRLERDNCQDIGEWILKDFIRFGDRPVMDYSFLCKCFKAIRPKTWKKINKLSGGYAVKNKQSDTKRVRADTTVVESNIHYPTDASLLWDSYRVFKRLLVRAREHNATVCPHRFHDKKVKGHYLFVTRYISSKSKSRKCKVKRRFVNLINSVERVVRIAEEFSLLAKASWDIVLAGIESELEVYLKGVKNVVEVTKRVEIHGEAVLASERTFSIFEQHVELIK